MAPRPVILDCDPGHDDAVAILMALGSAEEIEILGITTVAGNVPLDLTHLNARKICELARRPDVPVYAGCDRPLVRALVTAELVHGKTGLDGYDLPEPQMKLRGGHAVDFIIETVRGSDRKVTLTPTGPLTNIATAIQKAPDILANIEVIVLMGGAIGQGNTTPSAEFNIYVDPHAAKTVFDSGAPLVMLGLDVTHLAITTPDRLAAIRAIGTPVGEAVAALLDFYDRFDMERYGLAGGPLHDPTVIAYILAPRLFGGRTVHVEIETESALTMGRTVVDWWGIMNRPANATVIETIDVDGFYSLLTERLARL